MARVAAGDGRAFRKLANELLAPLVRYAWRLLGNQHEAEEVSQEALLRLWQKAPDWQPRAQVKTWVYKVAHNLALDLLRRRRDLPEETDGAAPTSQGPGRLLEQKELVELVQTAVSGLPEKQRAAISLLHYHGFTQTEAAAVLGTSVEAVESLAARGRRALRLAIAPVFASASPTADASPTAEPRGDGTPPEEHA